MILGEADIELLALRHRQRYILDLEQDRLACRIRAAADAICGGARANGRPGRSSLVDPSALEGRFVGVGRELLVHKRGNVVEELHTGGRVYGAGVSGANGAIRASGRCELSLESSLTCSFLDSGQDIRPSLEDLVDPLGIETGGHFAGSTSAQLFRPFRRTQWNEGRGCDTATWMLLRRARWVLLCFSRGQSLWGNFGRVTCRAPFLTRIEPLTRGSRSTCLRRSIVLYSEKPNGQHGTPHIPSFVP